MATQTAPLSIEEFHRLYDGAKPAYEYWYGLAIRKPIPTLLHGVVQFLIMKLLEQEGWKPASEVRLKARPDAEPVPDVVAQRRKFKGRYPTTAPELCVEILSPGDRLASALRKAGDYMAWGAECVWIIDPEMRTAWMILAESGPEAIWVAPEGTLRAGGTTIKLTALFAGVDDMLDITSAEA